jgi:coenzyme F420-dependent glucose-6-phosphate dehydrogenase
VATLTDSPLQGVAPDSLNASTAKIGYTLSSEEFQAPELVKHAAAAEEAGFEFALISDHFHPWTTNQGNSPFVWSTLAAISQVTEKLTLGTGVTCPTTRVHPAIVAQAAATTATLLPGRFFLGLGSGERLNEHIVGGPWPDNGTRLEMLEEAVELIRDLWSGDLISHDGMYYSLDRARIFSLPDQLPPIFIAAGGPRSAEVAARVGEGLVGVAPQKEMIDAYLDGASDPGPRVGQIQFCFADSREKAADIAIEYWPNAVFGGNLMQEVALPSDFESIAELVKPDDLNGQVSLGNDPDEFVEALNKYVDAGYDHIYFHQIGPDQQAGLDFVSREVLPAFKAQS